MANTRRKAKRKPTRSPIEDAIRKQLGRRAKYEPERLTYTVNKTYIPDFVLDNGIRIEVKGWFTSADRSKLLAVRKAHPDLDLRLVFQRASNNLRKGSTTTYADWADKHGFLWSEGTVPQEWLDV